MSCYFCSTSDHLTPNCDTYKSDDERQKFFHSKNCCRSCLTVYDSSRIWCQNCKVSQKCYYCFSWNHHTVYCPDRFTESPLFPPNIDQNLFSRFTEMLTIEKKYFMAFSFPSFFASIILKPLRIKSRKETSYVIPRVFSIIDVIVAEKYKLLDLQFRAAKNLTKFPILWIKYVELNNPNFSLSSFELLYILSSKTKTLVLQSKIKKGQQKLTFREILKKAPNLEEINMLHTNVEIGNSWPDDLLEFNNGEELNLKLSLRDVNFNINSLATLMRCKPAIVHLDITLSDDAQNESFNAFKKKFEKLFTLVDCEEKQYICVTYDNKPSDIISRKQEYYMLK